MTLDTKALGNRGEQLAAEHLIQQGYTILAQNYRAGRHGEIDIIAQHKTVIVFVEVKARRGATAIENALAAITPSKQQQLYKTADHYIANSLNQTNVNYRFDIIAINMTATPPAIQHIENALAN